MTYLNNNIHFKALMLDSTMSYQIIKCIKIDKYSSYLCLWYIYIVFNPYSFSLPEKVLVAYSHCRKRKFSLVGDLNIDGFRVLEVEDDASDHEAEKKRQSCCHGKTPNTPGIEDSMQPHLLETLLQMRAAYSLDCFSFSLNQHQ